MPSYVLLVQNGDLFHIGSTDNLKRAKQLLLPGKLIASLRSEDSDKICLNLQSKYQSARVPDTNYFRLTKSQSLECRSQLENISGVDFFQPFFVGGKLFLAFLFAWVIISFAIIKFGIDPIFSRFL
tara:strand:- start:487 stop:864 length:378 start_codon:yes stop_codon:yes gene_type:complete